MKTAKLLVMFLFVAANAAAQCYSKIVSYSRNYIALQTDGTLWAKGTAFNDGLLGFGNSNAVAEFAQIGTDNNWTESISLNGINVFAIKTDGTLWVWGNNFPNGSAGLGSFALFGPFVPTQVGTDTDWAKVASGSSFTLAVKTNGTLWAWGSNAKGQLGISNPDDLYKTNVPIQVGTENNWSKVFAGLGNSAYAIKTDGTLYSWGSNGINIGYANASVNNIYRTPHQVGTDTWLTVSVGGSLGAMTDGIKTDGSLWGWGSSSGNAYLFGNGIDVYSSETPIQIGTDSDWTQVCLGIFTTIALKNNGTRWGWGRNGTGYQLGMGTGFTSNVFFPTQLDADTDWNKLNIDLDNGGYGDGIKQNNSLYHWGNTHPNVIYPSPTLFSASNCSLGIDEFFPKGISVYPNPLNDIATIRFNESEYREAEIFITNNLGQILFSEIKKITNGNLSLNMSQLPAGIYYVSFQTGEKMYKTKIIKN